MLNICGSFVTIFKLEAKFITLTNKCTQSLYIQLFYTKTLKTATCFDPCGTIISDCVHQIILYKISRSMYIKCSCVKHQGVRMSNDLV